VTSGLHPTMQSRASEALSSFQNWAEGTPLGGFLLLNLGYPSGQICIRPIRIVLDRQETPSPLRDGSHMPVSFHDTDQPVFRGDTVWPVLYHTCGVVCVVEVDFTAGQADRGPH
jgi:hypothetical protein